MLRRSANLFRRRPQPRRSAPRRTTSTAAPADLRRAVPRLSEHTLLRVSGWAMIIFVALLAGFLVHLLVISQLAEHRSQRLLYDEFRTELASGTAPVGQVDVHGDLLAMGAPVAVLSIPALGVTDTVVEGTSGRALLSGPGHRRDTPLPGQSGISVIYGRQAAYGGPFRDISHLQPGDTITTITGQGTATYQVLDVRRAGDTAPAMPSATSSRLTLVTAAGVPFASGSIVRVDASLEGRTEPTPQPVLRLGSLTHAEDPMASDPSGWLPMALWLELVLVAGVLLVLALRRWGRWHTWIVGVPVVILLGIEIAQQVVLVLPNLY
ncbi:MAG: sortase [Nocardioidaceae bacterium]|nr:sortase [Nocardioidaceae bacterium]MCL2614320.1 sortase [Nocardioidaceae bacterium]